MVTLPDRTLTPRQVRELCQRDALGRGTSGFSPGHTQANVIILPSKYAEDFRLLCKRNPVPCPLLGETRVGDWLVPSDLADDCDIRTSCGLYRVYEGGELVEEVTNIKRDWTDDSVAFFIGCSHSFEDALEAAGFSLRHVQQGSVVSCYRTTVPLMQAGVFSGNMVVSMRPFKKTDVPLVQQICRPYVKAHGEPVAFGAEGTAALGIRDVSQPEWGAAMEIKDDEVPVYWGCGVTPQQVVLDSKIPERVLSHSAGHMLVLDMTSEGVCERPEGAKAAKVKANGVQRSS